MLLKYRPTCQHLANNENVRWVDFVGHWSFSFCLESDQSAALNFGDWHRSVTILCLLFSCICLLVLVNDPDDAIFSISLNLETYRSLLDGFPLTPNLNKWDDRLWPCIHISKPSVPMINTWCYSLNFHKTLFSSSSSDRSNDDHSNVFVTAMATISLQNQRLISDRNKR